MSAIRQDYIYASTLALLFLLKVVDYKNFPFELQNTKILIIIYVEGNAARQSFIVPRLATSYLTTKGKSFSKNTSI